MTLTGSVIAIDHGTKRTGFAVVDPLRVVTQPLSTWHGDGQSDELLEYVAALVDERTVAALVVGMPLHGDGRQSARGKEIATFMERLRVRLPGLTVVAHDEHLSTKEAEDRLREAGHHGEARKARRDSWSAVVILEDWVNSGEPTT